MAPETPTTPPQVTPLPPMQVFDYDGAAHEASLRAARRRAAIRHASVEMGRACLLVAVIAVLACAYVLAVAWMGG